MQKKIIALAVAALASGYAVAQSNVTVYGIVDVGYNYFSANGNKYSGINDGGTGGLNTSRFGFKGEEALGNGLKALFTVEYGLAADTGVLGTTSRQTFAGVSGGFGTVTMGRQYSPSGLWMGNTSSNGITTVHASNFLVAPQSGQGFVTMQTGGGSRWDNSIAYQTNDISGFSARAIYGFGENVRDSFGDANSDASKFGLGVQYANGPFYATAIYQAVLANDGIANDDGNKAWMLGGSYDFKVVKLFANYVKEHEESAKGTTTYALVPAKGLVGTTTYAAQDLKKTYWSLGASAPVSAAGAVQFEFAKYKTDVAQTTAKGYSLGYTHSLSKRTTLYTAVSRISNDDATGANVVRVAGTGSNGENITGFAAGFNHKF